MWKSPVPHRLIPTVVSESFREMPDDATGLPLTGHPGCFAHRRRFHTHQGVDLYVPEGTAITCVEDGVIVAIHKFTGEHAEPPTPWWGNTWSVMVEGQSGVVCYGEIIPDGLQVGAPIEQGAVVGHVTPVLLEDRGRPMSMLHLELYRHGVREPADWQFEPETPEGLMDPTPHLLAIAEPTED
jgi:hypothetical protein